MEDWEGKGSDIVGKARQGEAHADGGGFRQNHPDANGFAPGKQPEKPDGMWRSKHPDAHGCYHSSIKGE